MAKYHDYKVFRSMFCFAFLFYFFKFNFVTFFYRTSCQPIRTVTTGYALSSMFVPGDKHVIVGTKVKIMSSHKLNLWHLLGQGVLVALLYFLVQVQSQSNLFSYLQKAAYVMMCRHPDNNNNNNYNVKLKY